MVQSVTVLWLPLVAATLVLKTAVLSCVTDNVLVEAFCDVDQNLLPDICHHSYSNTTLQCFNLALF